MIMGQTTFASVKAELNLANQIVKVVFRTYEEDE